MSATADGFKSNRRCFAALSMTTIGKSLNPASDRQLGHSLEGIPSGAEARTFLGGVRGPAKAVPFYKALRSPSRDGGMEEQPQMFRLRCAPLNMTASYGVAGGTLPMRK